MTTKHTFALLLILAALFSAACGGDSSPTAPTPPAAAAPAPPPPPPPPAPLWTRSGTGADVFAKPITVTRVRIVGDYGGRAENFVVRCDGSLLVNVIVGTSPIADAVHYEGTHLATACTQIEVRFSNGVTWSLTEVR